MPHHFFIAGTDTEIGKTFVSIGLLKSAASKGLATLALKPIAAGCEPGEQGLCNGDALALKSAMTTDLPYKQVNPVALAPAIAPHIALAQNHRTLTAQSLAQRCAPIINEYKQHFIVVEGAGGWRVPLNDTETLAALPKHLNLPVVLVVGLRLGCISHALLTVEAIYADGLAIAGWVANTIDPDMPVMHENIASLRTRISAPFLGHIPFLTNASRIDASQYLDIDKLLEK
ncbi:MAG: dethiobiotin synthase [Pseudomonadota bacterium]